MNEWGTIGKAHHAMFWLCNTPHTCYRADPSTPPPPMQQERTWKNAKKLQKPTEKGFFMFSWGYRECWDIFGTGCTPSAWAMRVWSHTFPIHTCITLWVFFQSFFSKHRWLIAYIGISNSINQVIFTIYDSILTLASVLVG